VEGLGGAQSVATGFFCSGTYVSVTFSTLLIYGVEHILMVFTVFRETRDNIDMDHKVALIIVAYMDDFYLGKPKN
jgi:hypothetical protein